MSLADRISSLANRVGTEVAAVRAQIAALTADGITDATATGKALLRATSAAAARSAIGAGTSNLAIGTTASTAKAGNYTPPNASTAQRGLVELATNAEAIAGTDATRAITPAGLKAVKEQEFQKRSGTFYANTGSLTQLGNVYATTFTRDIVVWPYDPSYEAIRISALSIGTGYGNVSLVGAVVDDLVIRLSMRFTQVGNATPQNVRIYWETVPIA